MGRRRRQQGRPVSGILLLDKPLGLSSNQALQRVKKLFDARKAGHTGSLDPLADGMLQICFGDATKLSAFLLDADKHYVFRVKLGETTVLDTTLTEQQRARSALALVSAKVQVANIIAVLRFETGLLALEDEEGSKITFRSLTGFPRPGAQS